MDRRQKLLTGALAVLVSVTLFVFVSSFFRSPETRQSNVSPEVREKSPVAVESVPEVFTVEGTVVALNETDLVISNHTPQPAVFTISTGSPVFKLDKGKQEISAGLAEVKTGGKVRVFFENSSALGNPVAKKILILETGESD